MTWAITWARTPAAALAVALAAGCSGAASASPGSSHSAGKDRPAGVATSTAGNGNGPGGGPSGTRRHRALPRLPHLTDRQLAGQRVIYSYSGLTPPAGLLAKIRARQVAGVIFFSGNISSQASSARSLPSSSRPR